MQRSPENRWHSPEARALDAISEIAGGESFASRREVITAGLKKALEEGSAFTAAPILAMVGRYGAKEDSDLISGALESPIEGIRSAAERAHQTLRSRIQS